MSRPSWDSYFIQIAKLVATRSTCLRRNVGAVLVRNKRILTTGYNGAASGLPHCLDIGCLRDELNIPSGERQELCRAIHAEANAIIQAGLHGVSTQDSTLYVTTSPCITCSKMLIQAGIKRIVYTGDEYGETEGIKLMKEAGIKIDKI